MEEKIEVYILGSGDHSDCAAIYKGEEIRVDLITADGVDMEENLIGKASLEGFWDDEVFVVENLTMIN